VAKFDRFELIWIMAFSNSEYDSFSITIPQPNFEISSPANVFLKPITGSRAAMNSPKTSGAGSLVKPGIIPPQYFGNSDDIVVGGRYPLR